MILLGKQWFIERQFAFATRPASIAWGTAPRRRSGRTPLRMWKAEQAQLKAIVQWIIDQSARDESIAGYAVGESRNQKWQPF
jgi:hypothetical protein